MPNIEILGLRNRTRHCLLNAGLTTVEEVEFASDAQLLAIPEFGRISLQDLRDCVDEWRRKSDGFESYSHWGAAV